jgi:hypothetical protein
MVTTYCLQLCFTQDDFFIELKKGFDVCYARLPVPATVAEAASKGLAAAGTGAAAEWDRRHQRGWRQEGAAAGGGGGRRVRRQVGAAAGAGAAEAASKGGGGCGYDRRKGSPQSTKQSSGRFKK